VKVFIPDQLKHAGRKAGRL